ncbi:hypothetical protein AWB79_07527 [Caballeronia hypogeia]|uniref:Bacteriophage protein n=1 Tax=Caballeronia hypogeia TaxID=1777140 RepID=A0A158DUI9_9BURK|nr:hypothetical protein [Caballeronia hypogeia]SAK97856.1 hypothetical protein AWB79_07527 [Caballeronia hypogeia]
MIKKDWIVPSTGALATVHVVAQVQLDYSGSNTLTASVSSFVDEAAYAANKFAMFVQQIPIDGLPADGENPQDYAYARLVEAVPDGEVTPYANRRVFALGEIVPNAVAAPE